jgi:tetratricopeptide (TPR) repeat protein
MMLRLLSIALLLSICSLCTAQKETDDNRAREIIAFTTAWIEDGQKTVDNFWNRGVAYHQLDSLSLAFADFDRAVKMVDSLKARLYDRRATVNYDMGHYEASISDFDKAIALDANNLAFRVGRGSANLKLNDVESANNDFQWVLNMDSTNELALYNQAVMYWDVPSKKQIVLSNFKKLLQYHPTAEYFYFSGQYFIELENYSAALKDFENALTLESDNTYYRVERAFCLGMLGKNSEAKLAFAELAKADNSNALLYWRRGLWFSHFKKDSKACIDFQRAKSLGMQVEASKLDLMLKKCK